MRDIDQISYRRGLYAGRRGLPRDPNSRTDRIDLEKPAERFAAWSIRASHQSNTVESWLTRAAAPA